jgi:DNA adenine methylase
MKTKKLTPPLKWHGGKHHLAERILELMPRHLRHVEPHFGGGRVLFRRDPSDRRLWRPGPCSDGRKPDGASEVVNDIDGELMSRRPLGQAVTARSADSPPRTTL